jgi:hypothetical protein
MSNNPNKLASKHTHGNWEVKKLLDYFVVQTSYEETICDCGYCNRNTDAIDSANAHLISAAPEAIEFISDLMPIFELMNERILFDKRDIDKLISGAEAILKKAYNL